METSSNTKSLLICLLLGLVTFAVFYQVHSFQFVNYDDGEYVQDNLNIRSGLIFKFIQWAFTSGYASNWHPLTWFSHMLDWKVFGANAGGHHIINLLFHIANVLLLFIILKRMTGAIWASAFVAGLFALHPLHVESVAWVSERKDVLSQFFGFLTIWAYVGYVNKNAISRYLLVCLFLGLGLMSKPTLVTLPFVLLLLDFWPLNRINSKGSIRPLIIEKIPLFLMAAASSVVTYLVQQEGGTFTPIPIKLRIFNAAVSYVEYIKKMLWPDKLAYFYPHAGSGISISYFLICAGLLLVITGLAFVFAKNHKYLLTGWLWFLGTLVPVIGLVQVGTQAMADRYSYISLTGLFIIIAFGLKEIFGKQKILIGLVSISILFALGSKTYFQIPYWKDSKSLFEHALKVTDNNYKAHLGMTDVLLKEGNVTEANYHMREAVRIRPDFVETLNDAGSFHYKTGRLDDAIDCYKMALAINADDPEVNANIGIALATKGDYAQAAQHYRIALKKINTPAVHNNMGYALANMGKLDDAIEEFKIALELNPEYKSAKANLEIFTKKKQIQNGK